MVSDNTKIGTGLLALVRPARLNILMDWSLSCSFLCAGQSTGTLSPEPLLTRCFECIVRILYQIGNWIPGSWYSLLFWLDIVGVGRRSLFDRFGVDHWYVAKKHCMPHLIVCLRRQDSSVFAGVDTTTTTCINILQDFLERSVSFRGKIEFGVSFLFLVELSSSCFDGPYSEWFVSCMAWFIYLGSSFLLRRNPCKTHPSLELSWDCRR